MWNGLGPLPSSRRYSRSLLGDCKCVLIYVVSEWDISELEWVYVNGNRSIGETYILVSVSGSNGNHCCGDCNVLHYGHLIRVLVERGLIVIDVNHCDNYGDLCTHGAGTEGVVGQDSESVAAGGLTVQLLQQKQLPGVLQKSVSRYWLELVKLCERV